MSANYQFAPTCYNGQTGLSAAVRRSRAECPLSENCPNFAKVTFCALLSLVEPQQLQPDVLLYERLLSPC
jgi:hypothetical protein